MVVGDGVGVGGAVGSSKPRMRFVFFLFFVVAVVVMMVVVER